MRKHFSHRATLLAALCGIVASATCAAATLEDTFTGSALNPSWAVVIPKAGPTVAVNNGLQITVPAGSYNDWTAERNAPRIEIPAPAGDFTITAHLKSVVNTDGSVLTGASFGVGILITFRENAANEDAYIFGPNGSNTTANLERTAIGMESIPIKGIPVWLKVQKTGNQYHFFARDEGSTDADWVEVQLADGSGAAVKTMNSTPLNIGLTIKQWAGNGITATFDDFKVDATALPANTFVSGTVNANGGDPTTLQVQLVDGTGRIVQSTAPDASGKYSLGAVPGTYTIQIQKTSLVDNPNSDLQKPGVVLSGTAAASADFNVHGLTSLNLASASLPSGTAWKIDFPVDKTAFDAVGAVNFDDSGDGDATVPSDVSGTVGSNLDFAYRLKFDVPDAMVGKDLLLNNFVVDDGIQAAYFNGTNLGSSTEDVNQGGPANSWTISQSIIIPGSLVKKTGNVLVIITGQGTGGAGMTGNAPTLQTLPSSTGALTGKVTTANGTGLLSTFKLLNSSGQVAATVNTSGPLNGSYTVTGLAPGTYTVDPATGSFSGGTGVVTITGGAVTTANVAPGGVNLGSAALPTGAGWKVGVVDAGDFSAAAANFTGTLSDVTVPGDIATITGNGVYFVYRLTFDLPADYVGKDLVLSNFVLDDGVEALYFNNTNLGSSIEDAGLGGPAGSWAINQTYVIPASLVKQTGNVLAIFGHDGSGGIGMTGGAPVIYPIPASAGVLTGHLVDSTGKPTYSPLNFLDASGNVAVSGSSSGPGYGQFAFVALPGSYSLDTLTTQFTGAPTSIAVQAGKITDLGNITAGPYPFFEDATVRPTDDDFSAATLDPKWKLASVGDSSNSAAKISSGVLGVTDASSNIWVNPNDNFTYVYQSIPNGDYSATVQVVNIPSTRDWEVGGLMLRNSLDTWSAMAFNQVSPGHTTQDKNRLVQDANDTDNNTTSPLGSDLLATGTLYVKMRKVGTRVAFYWTTDPTDPTKTGFGHVFNIAGLNGSNLLVGIASDSQNYEAIEPEFQYDNFKLVPLAGSTPTVLKGDLNGDNKVNIADATMALQFAVGNGTPTAAQIAAGDVVGNDGKIGIPDVTKILQAAIGAIQL